MWPLFRSEHPPPKCSYSVCIQTIALAQRQAYMISRAVGQFAVNKLAVYKFAVYKFAVWTVRRTDSLPYGQFAVRTVCRKTVGRMTILPYGQFAVKRYFKQILP